MNIIINNRNVENFLSFLDGFVNPFIDPLYLHFSFEFQQPYSMCGIAF